MANTQFGKNVGVGRREVRDRVITEDQELEHGFVNDATTHLFVCAKGFQLSGADGGRDELVVDGIEVDEAGW